MVTGEKFVRNAALRYRLGTIFLWLGIFTWLPFIFLKAIGEKPQFFLFLPFHLLGVVGGSRLRSLAWKEMDVPLSQKSGLRLVGHLLIFLGILVWAPYLYMKLLLGQPVEVMNYLPYHLTGIFGGISLYTIDYFRKRSQR